MQGLSHKALQTVSPSFYKLPLGHLPPCSLIWLNGCLSYHTLSSRIRIMSYHFCSSRFLESPEDKQILKQCVTEVGALLSFHSKFVTIQEILVNSIYKNNIKVGKNLRCFQLGFSSLKIFEFMLNSIKKLVSNKCTCHMQISRSSNFIYK